MLAAAAVLVAAGRFPSAESAAGGSVIAYPQPGSRTASPQTQISIRGVAANKIGTVTVVGAESGAHETTAKPDSDGDGASLFLDPALTPGETVTVRTSLAIVGAARGAYTFTVSRPVEDVVTPLKKPDNPTVLQSFASAPDLRPPALTMTGALPAADGDVFLAPYQGRGPYGPMIVDPSGQLVWFHPLPDGVSAFDFRVQPLHGRKVLTWWQGVVTNGHGQGEGVILDSSYRQLATVRAGNGYSMDLHDFSLTGGDVALITAYQPVRWDLSSIGGSADGVVFDCIAQEIDIVTGNVLMEWHALDHVSPADSYAGTPDPTAPYDYFHINSLDLNQAGQLLISARATHTVYDVAADTGTVLWQLGGKNSSFTGPGTDFSSQHDARWIGPNRIGLFDNAEGVGDPTAEFSSGMVIQLDRNARRATVATQYGVGSVPRAPSQGDLQLLPHGGAFVGWGQQPYLSQFDASGQLVWQAELAQDYQSYRAFRFPWTGHPRTTPAVVAAGTGDGAIVHVSWNGATGVATWRVFTGESADTVVASVRAPTTRPAASGPSTGFEAALTVPGPAPAYVLVQALDWRGQVLGASGPVPVTRH